MKEIVSIWLKDLFSTAPSFLLRLAFVFLCIFVGRKLIRLICRSFEKIIELRGADPLLASFTQSFFKYFLNITLFFVVISILGIRATSMVAFLGTAGIAVGLALQGSLSDLAGGVLILLFKPFSKGDYISNNAGIEGIVDQIFILNTILTTTDNKNIVMPNGQLAHSVIINYSQNPVRRLDMVFAVSYDSPTEKVKEILTKIAEEHPKILNTKVKTIRLVSFNDSSISFTFKVWVNSKDYWDVYYDCNEIVRKVFEENNIEIPYPKLDVHQK
jgi:small conductance mechanosensitive channel